MTHIQKLMLATLIYAIVVTIDLFMTGGNFNVFVPVLAALVTLFSAIFFIGMFGILILAVEAMARRQSLLQTDYWRSQRWRGALIEAACLVIFLSFFCISKSYAHFAHPYVIDPALSMIDKAIHFGHYPHEFLLSILGGAGVAVIDRLYVAWLFVMLAVSGYCIFFDFDDRRRKRFLWTTFLSWMIGGNLLAFALASVGPIYFHEFYPQANDPYQALVAFLHTGNNGGPFLAAGVSGALLTLSRDHVLPDLNGILAMPSLHVGIAWLMALYLVQVNRWAGVAAFVYAATILAGSVVLGWHYAIDGYVAILLVSLLWAITGFALKPANPSHAP